MAKSNKKPAATKPVNNAAPIVELSKAETIRQWAEHDDHKTLSTSEKVRQLTASGYTRGEISKGLNIRYQHVRNVLVTPLKRPTKAAE